VPLLGVIALALALTPAAQATSGTLFITSNTTLTEDHQGNIVIAADGVTLDCAGHLVDPADPTMWGAVLVNGYDDVTVRNCRVTNALNGIAVDGSSERTLVAGNHAFGNANAGIAASNAVDTRIVGNSVTGNLDNGIGLFEVTGVQVESNVALGNQGTAGIAMFRSQSGMFRDNTTTGNVHNGVHLAESNANVFTKNTSFGNGADGFSLHGGLSNELLSNSSNDNGTYGFVLNADGAPTSGNTLAWNQASDNGFEGIALVFGASYNEVIGNISQRGDFEGISLFFGSDHNVIRANVLTGNASSGVLLVQSSYNSIIANRSMRNNTQRHDNAGGISVIEGSSFNEVRQNVACANANADAYHDGTGAGNVWEANVFCTTIGV
jgi:parallel beta-helix repeat protein